MKKYLISAALLVGSFGFIVSTTQSCTTLATSDVGLSVIKKVLLGGISRASSIFSDKNAFLRDNLIDKALPVELQKINSILQKIAPSLVAKEKDYIAQAAAYTVGVSTPILQNAVNNLNSDDITRILQGEKGTATLILKEKTSNQLVAAILPKVDEKLNEFGIVKNINMALKGNSILGSLLGGQNNSSNLTNAGLSEFASQQIVNGLFNIVEDYEMQNRDTIHNIIKSK